MRTIRVKLLKWAIFSVFLAVMPLLPPSFRYLVRDDVRFNRDGLWEHGELLLVSAGIAASAIGDLAMSGLTKSLNTKLLAGGATAAITLLSTWLFAEVSFGWQTSKAHMSSHGVSILSWWIFFGAFVTGGTCINISD